MRGLTTCASLVSTASSRAGRDELSRAVGKQVPSGSVPALDLNDSLRQSTTVYDSVMAGNTMVPLSEQTAQDLEYMDEAVIMASPPVLSSPARC